MSKDLFGEEVSKRSGRSFEVSELIKKLSTLKKGESIKYDDLTSVVMGDCSPKGDKYPYLLNCRKVLIKEFKMVFKAVPNEGLERLDDSGIVDRSNKKLAGITRQAKKEMQILTFPDYDNLIPEQKLVHNTNMSIFNVVKTVGQADKVKKIAIEIKNMGNNRLEIAETIKAFQNA